ncbi:RNA-binding protein 39 [Trifolium pratense]|nr:RNA-binding protein 39 [Trifolium pratense]XP_045808547.1 RNA-binding protein 39 [Trifolium pratense]
MEFDEYDYLEKTVDNSELKNHNQITNSGGDRIRTVKSEDRVRSRSSKRRDCERDDGDGDDDLNDRLKHSKSGDGYRGGYDRQKERGSPRNRSRSRDVDKERDKLRSSQGNGDRRRDRDRDSGDKYRRERDRDRDVERDRRNRRSESEREREKERSQRSRSRPERHRSDLDNGDRETSRDREYSDKERNRDKDYRDRGMARDAKKPDRENRRHEEKKEEAAEPEIDPERDQRTVFAYQISLKADERDVYEFFSRAGKVRDVRLIMDRNSRRSKGVGYIEFYDVMSVPMAIALSGQPLLGQPVMVKPSEAEKNLAQSTASVTGGPNGNLGPYSGGARRLYVGNLHSSITEADLRRVFEAFGQVELVQLPLDDIGHCKGFGFVQFARLEDAKNAQSLNSQLEIGGRTIKVSAVTDQSGMQEFGGNTGDMDDDEGGGLSLNASSRALLMQKLDRSSNASSMIGLLGNSAVNNTGLNLQATGNIPEAALLGAAPLAGHPGGGLQIPMTSPSIDTIGVPSECLLLKNMFDPENEKEPDFDLDVREDVEAECSKFGNLRHLCVVKQSAGFVYLRFENTQSAISAQRALHGRWFAGKMITASFMVTESYEDRFPLE